MEYYLIGQVEQFSWASDMTAMGLLAVVLIIIFWIIIPKVIDIYKDVLIARHDATDVKINLAVRVLVKMGLRLKHVLRHQHDLLKEDGHICEHADDDEDEPDLESLNDQ